MVEARALTFSYPRSHKRILDKVSFTLEDGQVLAVLGTNGAGKSTLLHCIDGLLKPQEGGIYLDGNPFSVLNRRILAQQVVYVQQQNVPPELIRSVYNMEAEILEHYGRKVMLPL